ncbi:MULTISPECIES: type II toxin-antitoxin system PemK/MazF family toxin [unclassified Methanoregula]|uniref:type II toxin-antitoxin system PemK/MazF family toxin n=1 Tax=unclassified Methanoregula TaxID=2649730 RepID=UPI0009C97D59|nr:MULTISPECIES: type II toxin-antitoxin system PemK/MazF family toxin [unclassified Methanoregula]OPX64136.1 MAG: PemK-like protein [Methanoregula sp. PtaB.Bin085]OPY34744.1 MAG: PemK-like protein [Methanoregula sp. PtaU1.Bin006]
MEQYSRGDVLLASVALDDRAPPKVRPVVVIGTDVPGRILICPVSSRPPFDAPCLPLALDDFAAGGLEMFGESYVMTSRVLTIRNAAVAGKKGRLSPESLAEISAHVPVVSPAGSQPGQKRPGRQTR